MLWLQVHLRLLCAAFSEPGALHVFEEQLFNFRKADVLKHFRVLTDQEYGGLTTASVKYSTEEGKPEGCLVFEGQYSSEVPRHAPPDVHKLGQAALQSNVRCVVNAASLWQCTRITQRALHLYALIQFLGLRSNVSHLCAPS